MNRILNDNLQRALDNRKELIEKLTNENTDTFRLFHGVNEGFPGLTIDRYNEQILIQTFYDSLDPELYGTVEKFLEKDISGFTHIVYNDRSRKKKLKDKTRELAEAAEIEKAPHQCTELGVKYTVRGKHRGQDPLLFLDMRAGRRWVLKNSADKSLLNLFAYTCGVGVAASKAGAAESVNVDFARSSLDFGVENAELNNLNPDKITFIHEDVIPVIRQFAGLKVSGRAARKHKFLKVEQKQFDIVYMDPPRWAKTPFGAIDLVNDYQSLFKPALFSTKPGGTLFCTNHVPQVELNHWLELMKKCALKNGREIKHIEIIEPEEDFPSPDGKHPLKMAALTV